MARGYNKATIMGNLTRDPELRYTVERRAWARFTVAVGYSWKNKNGEMQDETSFIPVVAWGPLGENCGRYLKKGRPVLVEGRIQTRSYDAPDGSGRKYVTEVVASDVVFLGSRRDGEGSSYDAPPPPEVSQGGVMAFPPAGSPFLEDDNFGKPFNEKGFGDFPPDFAETEKESGNLEADIPF